MAKHIPMRTCIVTREKKPKDELARFVYVKETGKVHLEVGGNIKGRGANISLSIDVFDKAIENGAFSRAFKTKVTKENLEELREEFNKYITKKEFRKGQEKVTVRVRGESVTID